METIWIDARAHRLIADESVKRRVRETGGPLFGYAVDGGVVITEARGPGAGARHERSRLVPDPDATQQAIDEIFKASGGEASYVGEWHTHPLGRVRPSRTDIKNAGRIAADAGVDFGEPVVLIQGTKILRRRVVTGQLAAHRWNSRKGALRSQRLIIVEADS
jgi:integrative and conjugative element protein (TIGR02256 family)